LKKGVPKLGWSVVGGPSLLDQQQQRQQQH